MKDLNDLLQAQLSGTAPLAQGKPLTTATQKVSDDELQQVQDDLLGTLRGVNLSAVFPDVDQERLQAFMKESESGKVGFFEEMADWGVEDVPFIGDVAGAHEMYEQHEAMEALSAGSMTSKQQEIVLDAIASEARGGKTFMGDALDLGKGALTMSGEIAAVALTGGAAAGAVVGKKAGVKAIKANVRRRSQRALSDALGDNLARRAAKGLAGTVAVATRAAALGVGVTAAKEAIPRPFYGIGAANATSVRRLFGELNAAESRDTATLLNENIDALMKEGGPMSWKGLSEVFMINSLEVAGGPLIGGVAGATLGKIPPVAYMNALGVKAIERGLNKLPGKGRTFERIQGFLRNRAAFNGEINEVAEELLQNTITEETFGNDWRDGLPEDFEELAAMFVGFGMLPASGLAAGTAVDGAQAITNRFSAQARARREQRKIPLAEGLSDQPDPTQQAPRDVTPEEYETFVGTGEVSDQTVAAIADQVMEGGARRREQEEFGAGVAYDTPDPRVQAFMGDAEVAARVEAELVRRAQQLEDEPAFESEVNQAAQAFGAAIGASEAAGVTVSATPRAMPYVGDDSPEAEQERKRSQLGYASSMFAQRLGRRLVFVDTDAARRDEAPRAAFDDATGVMFVDAAVENPLEAVVHEAQHSAFLRTRVADPEMQAQQMDYLRNTYPQQWSEAESLYQSRNSQYGELESADYEEEVAATMAEELSQEIVQAVFSDAQNEQAFRRQLAATIEEANQSPAGRGFWGRMLEALRSVAAAFRFAPQPGPARRALAQLLQTDAATAEDQARLIMDLVSLLEGTTSGGVELFEDEAQRLRFAPSAGAEGGRGADMTRRAFLRGAGATLALPYLKGMPQSVAPRTRESEWVADPDYDYFNPYTVLDESLDYLRAANAASVQRQLRAQAVLSKFGYRVNEVAVLLGELSKDASLSQVVAAGRRVWSSGNWVSVDTEQWPASEDVYMYQTAPNVAQVNVITGEKRMTPAYEGPVLPKLASDVYDAKKIPEVLGDTAEGIERAAKLVSMNKRVASVLKALEQQFTSSNAQLDPDEPVASMIASADPEVTRKLQDSQVPIAEVVRDLQGQRAAEAAPAQAADERMLLFDERVTNPRVRVAVRGGRFVPDPQADYFDPYTGIDYATDYLNAAAAYYGRARQRTQHVLEKLEFTPAEQAVLLFMGNRYTSRILERYGPDASPDQFTVDSFIWKDTLRGEPDADAPLRDFGPDNLGVRPSRPEHWPVNAYMKSAAPMLVTIDSATGAYGPGLPAFEAPFLPHPTGTAVMQDTAQGREQADLVRRKMLRMYNFFGGMRRRGYKDVETAKMLVEAAPESLQELKTFDKLRESEEHIEQLADKFIASSQRKLRFAPGRDQVSAAPPGFAQYKSGRARFDNGPMSAYAPMTVSSAMATGAKYGDRRLRRRLMPSVAGYDDAQKATVARYLALTPFASRAAGKSDTQVINEAVRVFSANALMFFDAYPAELRDRATQWYPGGNRLCEQIGKDFNVSTASAVSVMAAHSPQTEWMVNVERARQTVQVYTQHSNERLTPKMIEWAQGVTTLRKKKTVYLYTETGVLDAIKDKTLLQLMEEAEQAEAKARALPTAKARNRALADVKQWHWRNAGLWVRAFAHSALRKDYTLYDPEAQVIDVVRDKEGAVRRMGFMGTTPISKSLRILRSNGALEAIDEELGQGNKVRSFYMNLLHPYDGQGEVTNDTHNIAALALMPVGSSAELVAQGLAGSTKEFQGKGKAKRKQRIWVKSGVKHFGTGAPVSGMQGLYPVFADALREAAAQRNVIPREMQSIVWEAVRGLMDNRKTAARQNESDVIWDKYANRRISLAEAQRQLFALYPGIDYPAWAERDLRVVDLNGTIVSTKDDGSAELAGAGDRRGAVSSSGAPVAGRAVRRVPAGRGDAAAAGERRRARGSRGDLKFAPARTLRSVGYQTTPLTGAQLEQSRFAYDEQSVLEHRSAFINRLLVPKADVRRLTRITDAEVSFADLHVNDEPARMRVIVAPDGQAFVVGNVLEAIGDPELLANFSNMSLKAAATEYTAEQLESVAGQMATHPEIVRLRDINNKTQASTLDDAGGKFDEEWQRSRDWAGIVEDLYTDTEYAKAAATGGAPKKERKALIIAGGSASGKSTVADGNAERMGALIVDSDFAKERLPEFDGGNGAGRVHLESKAINKLLLARALTAGDNVVLPVVGSSGSSISKTIALLKRMGYTVGFKFIDVPKETAAARNFQRIHRTGRFIDPAYVDKQYESIAQNWPRGQAEADLAARLTNENRIIEVLEQEGDWASFGSEEDSGGVDAGRRPLRGTDDRGTDERARTSANDVEVSIDWYGGAEQGREGWTAGAVAVKSLGPNAVVGERRQRYASPIRRRRIRSFQLTPNELVQSMARDMLRRGEELPPFSDPSSTGLVPSQPVEAAPVTASGEQAPAAAGESTLQDDAQERRPQEAGEAGAVAPDEQDLAEASSEPAGATQAPRRRRGRERMLDRRAERAGQMREASLFDDAPTGQPSDAENEVEPEPQPARPVDPPVDAPKDAGFGANVPVAPVRVGNETLNNPGNTAETRAQWDIVDRDRAVRGGQVIGRAEAEQKARQALADDYDGTRSMLEQKLSRGVMLDTWENRAMVNIINGLFMQTLNPRLTEDQRREALHDGRELGFAYREMRAELARSMGSPVGLGMTAKEQVILLMMQLPVIEARRRARIEQELRGYLSQVAEGPLQSQYLQTFFGARRQQGSEYDLRNAPPVNERGQLISERRLQQLVERKRADEELDFQRQERARVALEKAGYDAFLVEDPDALLDPVHGHIIRNIISSAKATWTDKAIELRQSNLLTGISTHVVNTTGNSAMLVVNGPVQRLVEGMVADSLRLTMPQKDLDALPSTREIVPFMMGGIRAIPEAVKNFLEAIRTEGPIFEMNLKQAGAQFGAYTQKLDTQDGVKVAGMKGRAARMFSFTMLQAIDEMFKTIAGNMEASALAFRVAFREGLRGNSLQRRMDELMADKTNPVWTEALYFGREITLQDTGGEVAKESSRLLNAMGEMLDRMTEWMVLPIGSIAQGLGVKGASRDQNIALPVGLLLFPFRRVPLRLTAQALRRSPMASLGMVKNKVRGNYDGDDRLLVRDIADGFIAFGLFMMLLEVLDDEDDELPVITGSRPISRGEAGAEYRTAPPMSVRIGDSYYNYGRIEPLGTSMAVAIDAIDQYRRTGSTDAVATGTASLVGMLEDKTFLRSIGDLITIMREYRGGNVSEGEAAARFLRNLYVTPWVPNLIRQTARESAVEYQLPRSIVEDGYPAFMVDGMLDSKGEPIATGLTGVAPAVKRDLWGRPIRRGQGEDGFGSDLLMRLLTPMRHMREVKDISPIDMALVTANERIRRNELVDVDAYFPTLPTRNFTVTVFEDGEEVKEKRRMTSPQYDDFVRDAGQAAHAGLLRFLAPEVREAYDFSFTPDSDTGNLEFLADEVEYTVSKKMDKRDDWSGEFNFEDPGAAELAAIKAAKDAAYRLVRKELANRVTGQ